MTQSGSNNSNSARGLVLATMVIGIGLSGFFDGILLHQVLQWHHLLSLVPGEAFQSIATQIFADGMFHVLMYATTAAGLWMLWRRRRALSEHPLGWRLAAGGGLLGFGLWNVIDVGFFHWILGIHRIRLDVPSPLAYDLGWLALLGLVPLAAGWLILRGGGSGGARHGPAAAATLSLLALIAAPIAALPQPGATTALVLAAPGASAGEVYNIALAAGTPVVWSDGRTLAVSAGDPAEVEKLYRHGAWWVTRSPALAGCLASVRV